jgi:hypothetical protein
VIALAQVTSVRNFGMAIGIHEHWSMREFGVSSLVFDGPEMGKEKKSWSSPLDPDSTSLTLNLVLLQ